ncbi:PHP domain-containing protein, partial [Patescibacteria group bacterium]|nr:PHP domain-containing protein [Patescibacteria group bacterium]
MHIIKNSDKMTEHMDPKDFVHLHTHTYYSLLEALPGPKALVSRVKEQGMSAVAITDNGGLYGAVEFYKACKDAEIKPIIGIDMYLAQNKMTDKRPRIDDRPYRLPLIALNEIGYKNLLHITTSGFLDGFYYKPRVDKEFLLQHAEGIVAFSGALKGEIPMALSMSDSNKAQALVKEYQDIFGKEN